MRMDDSTVTMTIRVTVLIITAESRASWTHTRMMENLVTTAISHNKTVVMGFKTFPSTRGHSWLPLTPGGGTQELTVTVHSTLKCKLYDMSKTVNQGNQPLTEGIGNLFYLASKKRD